MREWSVRFAINRPDMASTEDHVDEIVANLRTHAASASYTPHELSARFNVTASTPLQAVREGLHLFNAALGQAGIQATEEGIVEAEAEAIPDLARRIDEPNVPDLVGVAEVARILKVSKQRASDLARSQEFPRPIEVPASGPVWKKSAILRHVGLWPRKPGRPKKTNPQGVSPI